MNDARLFNPDQIVPQLKSTSRWDAIDELIGALVTAGKIKPEQTAGISTAAKRRDSLASTSIGLGLAIPHAWMDIDDRFIGVLGRSETGIDFDLLDDLPVKFVLFYLMPSGPHKRMQQALFGFTKLFGNADFRKALEEAADAASMIAVIEAYGSQ